ncbi:MAG: alpha-ketoglutarate-dependent dioxygenase AlkB [Taibaiella sp.]|nr:alpha-ketoglutarate-dependent dioxygenase AlkB [Taibaiella sp.]
MQLFEDHPDKDKNYLPQDGIVNYLGVVLQTEEADHFFQQLLSHIEWENDKAIIFGKEIITKRKVAWYGDEPFAYTYSNTTKYALPWTKELAALKTITEKASGETFNSCLLNLYHTGEEGMAWHSDDEKDLKKNGAIASLSLGAERKFAFKHKISKEKVELYLPHGCLLIMKGTTQSHWLHRLPPTKKVLKARINLTFRNIER